MYEGVEPDTVFTGNAWAPLSIPGYASITFKQACMGQPVHGLHFSNNVLNTLDFPAPYTYALDNRFSTLQSIPATDPTDPNEFAWDGVTLVPKRPRVAVDSIASGYLCGSNTLIRVPGVLPRIPTAFDIANKISWKDYALRSTPRGFVLGMELGKNGFLFTTGVGKTFWIMFIGSTGDQYTSRKLRFTVTRFGVCGLPSPSYFLDYDTGIKDFESGGLINRQIVGDNYSVLFSMKICDVAINGTKCVLGMYIPNPGGSDDDGVNQLSSWCVSYAECSFSLVDGIVQMSGRIARQYKNNNSPDANSCVTGDGAIVRPGTLRRPDSADNVVSQIFVGLIVEDNQVFFGGGATSDTTIFDGTIRIGKATFTEGVGNGGDANVSKAVSFGQDVGQYRIISSGTSYDIRQMRTISMCYDKNDKLVPITVSSTKVDNVLIETTKSCSFQGTGRHVRKLNQTYYNSLDNSYAPNGDFCEGGDGTATAIVVTEREAYYRKCIELRVDGYLVDYIEVENIYPQTATTTTLTYGYVTTSPGASLQLISKISEVRESKPPEPIINNFTPALPGIVGPLNYIGSYAEVKQAGGSGFIRNTAIPDINSPLAGLQFFIRLESNKLVSANVGDAGYSFGVTELQASDSFKYYVETLAAGDHIKRTVWNCYEGAKAVSNVPGHGQQNNPIFNVSAAAYHCAFNVETKQSVINGIQPYTFI